MRFEIYLLLIQLRYSFSVNINNLPKLTIVSIITNQNNVK
jgi:hypothetical protein